MTKRPAGAFIRDQTDRQKPSIDMRPGFQRCLVDLSSEFQRRRPTAPFLLWGVNSCELRWP